MPSLLAALGVTTITINHLRLTGIVALILGILILIFPKSLNYLIAAYLIIIGLVSVFGLHL